MPPYKGVQESRVLLYKLKLSPDVKKGQNPILSA